MPAVVFAQPQPNLEQLTHTVAERDAQRNTVGIPDAFAEREPVDVPFAGRDTQRNTVGIPDAE